MTHQLNTRIKYKALKRAHISVEVLIEVELI